MVCTFLNFTVCDFVDRASIVLSGTLTGCCGLFLTLSFIAPLKTCHNQQRYHEKELAESLVRNTEGFLLFEHNPDPVFSLSREAAIYSFAFAPGGASSHHGPCEKGDHCQILLHPERIPILPLLQQNSGLCSPGMPWRSVICVVFVVPPTGRSLFSVPFCVSCFPHSLVVPPTSLPWSTYGPQSMSQRLIKRPCKAWLPSAPYLHVPRPQSDHFRFQIPTNINKDMMSPSVVHKRSCVSLQPASLRAIQKCPDGPWAESTACLTSPHTKMSWCPVSRTYSLPLPTPYKWSFFQNTLSIGPQAFQAVLLSKGLMLASSI